MRKPLLIALPGTGKTTTAKALCDLLNAGNPPQAYSVVSTDELFRTFRALPLSATAEGHEIMKDFVARCHTQYPDYAKQVETLATETDDQGRARLYDSVLFRSIGADKYGEDIFRTFEIAMLSWLNAQGRFDHALADLSASAPLYDENRAIFSADNNYRVFLLDMDEETTVDHLVQDYKTHRATGKTIRGAYESAVDKSLQASTGDQDTIIREALGAMHRKDRDKRMDKYRTFAHKVIRVDRDQTPQDVAQIIFKDIAA